VWVRRFVGIGLIGFLGVSCSTSPAPPTVRITLAQYVDMPPAMIVARLRRDCPSGSGRVTLNLITDDGTVRHTFDCAAVRNTTPHVDSELVQLVSGRHQAGRRADRIIAFGRALGITPYWNRTDLIWTLGTSVSSYSCDRASDVTFRRNEIAEAGQVGETPTHWLKVEAAYIAGACPDQLTTLLPDGCRRWATGSGLRGSIPTLHRLVRLTRRGRTARDGRKAREGPVVGVPDRGTARLISRDQARSEAWLPSEGVRDRPATERKHTSTACSPRRR
jgi:hypothetical protein